MNLLACGTTKMAAAMRPRRDCTFNAVVVLEPRIYLQSKTPVARKESPRLSGVQNHSYILQTSGGNQAGLFGIHQDAQGV